MPQRGMESVKGSPESLVSLLPLWEWYENLYQLLLHCHVVTAVQRLP